MIYIYTTLQDHVRAVRSDFWKSIVEVAALTFLFQVKRGMFNSFFDVAAWNLATHQQFSRNLLVFEKNKTCQNVITY